MPNFIQNIRHCIAGKSQKQKAFIRRCDEWWLILPDQIAYGFSDQEKEVVLSAIENPDNWTRIIVLSILTGKVILEF